MARTSEFAQAVAKDRAEAATAAAVAEVVAAAVQLRITIMCSICNVIFILSYACSIVIHLFALLCLFVFY